MTPPFDPMQNFTWVLLMVGYVGGVVVRPDAPLRGAAPNLQNLLGGQIQITADSLGWVPMAEEGRVRVLHDAFREALSDPSHVAILDRFDMQPNCKSSADYTAFVRQTMEEERRLIQQLGLRLS